MAIVFNNLSGGGGKLYEHNIRTEGNGSDSDYGAFTIISTDSTPITSVQELATWLYNNGYIDKTKLLPINASRYSSNKISFIYGIYSSNGTSVRYMCNNEKIYTLTIEETNHYLIGSTVPHSIMSSGIEGNLYIPTIYDYVREL